MLKPLLPLAALLVLRSVAADADPQRLAFTPREGWDVTCTMTEVTSTELTSSETVILLDGKELSEDDDLEVAQTYEVELQMSWRDEFLAVGEGYPTRLRRTFVEIAGDMEGEVSIEGGDFEESFSGGFESPLEGLAVVFAREDDGEGFRVEWEDDEGDDELLAGLSIDAFATWFLPEGEVEVGDEWDAGPEAWRGLHDIGGDMAIELDAGDDATSEEEEEAEDELERSLFESAEGEVTCTFEGWREVDGRELCVVAIGVSLRCAAEVEFSYVDELGDAVEAASEQEHEYELSGELLWDAALGRAHSLDIEGTAGFHEVSSESVGIDEGTVETRDDSRYAVELRITLAYD